MATIPTLKVNLLPQFPASVVGGNGISVAKTNGIFTISWNLSNFSQVASVPSNAQSVTFLPLYNAATQALSAISFSNFVSSIAFAVNAGALTNTRLAKTANYSVGTGDGGATLALGGNAFFTLTFPAASGYAASFAVIVVNEDTYSGSGSGRGKMIHSASGDFADFILWPGQARIIINDNNVWKAVPQTSGLWMVPPGITVTFFVDPILGNDANDGLASGSGALATIQRGVNTVSSNLFFMSTGGPVSGVNSKAVVQLAHGTYNECVVLKPYSGNLYRDQTICSIVGDNASPTSVNCKGASIGSVFFAATMAVPWYITGVCINPTSSSDNGFVLDWGSVLDIGTFTVLGATNNVIYSRYNSQAEILNGATVTVAANVTSFATAIASGIILAQGSLGSVTGVLSGNPAWGAGFASVQDQTSTIDLGAISWSGSSTGPKALINGGGTGAANPSNYPGSTPVQYTSPFVLGEMATGTQGGVQYFGASNVPASTAAGSTGQILQSNGTSAPTWVSRYPFFVEFKLTGVNFNSANNDNQFVLTLPSGFTRWQPFQAFITNPSTTFSVATFQMWTGAGGTGTSLLGTTTAALTSTADGTAGNSQSLSPATGTTQTFTIGGFPNVFFRTVTAQGSAATADVTLIVRVLP